VRELANQVAGWPASVLAEVAQALRVERVRDLPAPALIRKLAQDTTARMAAGSAGQSSATARPDVYGWLAGLLVAGDTVPARLCRRLVDQLGLEKAHSWFAAAAIERDGRQLVIRQPSKFRARHVAQHFTADVLLAARAEWPELAEADIAIVDGSAAAPNVRGHAHDSTNGS
jgi:hypothetical protein